MGSWLSMGGSGVLCGTVMCAVRAGREACRVEYRNVRLNLWRCEEGGLLWSYLKLMQLMNFLLASTFLHP